MLAELRVENLLLIEQAQLRLSGGLNVITGETGAGKTVLAHALDLLLGARARGEIVRPGASEAYVEGVFPCPTALRDALGERLPVDAEELVLARRVGRDGRTRAYLNGRTAGVGELRDLGASLISFYGQHEHRKLTIAGAQLELLDGVCGAQHALHLRGCARAHEQAARLISELAGLRELAGARERELDLLEHELAEIDSAEISAQEYERLLGARERLRRLDALCSAAGAGAQALVPDTSEAPGAASLLAGATAGLDAIGGVDERLDALAERLRALTIEAQDLAGELRDYGERAGVWETGSESVDASPDSALELVEERLAEIERLVRKHGGSIQAVLDHASAARARHAQLAGGEVALRRVEQRVRRVREELEQHVAALRVGREAAAPRLALAVAEQLRSLAMGDARFEIALERREPGPRGGDGVEFMIAPNPGVPAGPVREIASGGELSRVMLALSTAALVPRSPAGPPPRVLVFDEVDGGIGGQTARAVGARLRQLAQDRQVLCITHLPQIASLADRHFAIAKDTSAELTRTTVAQLGEREMVSELVRMLGADSSDAAARRHARELRRAA